MTNRDEILKEIMSDPDLRKKYGIIDKELNDMKCNPPYPKKITEIMATIINENANNRSARQIYPTIKNIHKI